MKRIILILLLMKGCFAFGQSSYIIGDDTITMKWDSLITVNEGTIYPIGHIHASTVMATKTVSDTATVIIFIAINDSLYKKVNGFEIRKYNWPQSGYWSSYDNFNYSYSILNNNWEQIEEKTVLKIEYVKDFPSLITNIKVVPL